MTRLTPERLETIRKLADDLRRDTTREPIWNALQELLAALDAEREAHAETKRWLAGRRKEHHQHLDDKLKLRTEIDALKAERDLLQIKMGRMYGVETAQERDRLRDENKALNHMKQEFNALKEENARLQGALTVAYSEAELRRVQIELLEKDYDGILWLNGVIS